MSELACNGPPDPALGLGKTRLSLLLLVSLLLCLIDISASPHFTLSALHSLFVPSLTRFVQYSAALPQHSFDSRFR